MKEPEHNPPDRAIVFLFPPRQLGQDIARRFSDFGYRVFLFLLSDEDENYFSHLQVANRQNVIPIRVTTPLARFWEGLDPALRSALMQARAVINSLGTDFSELKVTGRGEEWSINASDPAQIRFSFIDMVLSNSRTKEKSLWFNLGMGRHERTSSGEIFCNTRYGMIGLAKALELTPRLRHFEVICICLTYFHKNMNGAASSHCMHCVTGELAESAHPLSSERAIPEFLLNRIEELWR